MSALERHHLAILLEVNRQGTLSRAAEQLHLTQSALSHAIRKLEDQLGTRVWEKSGRRLELTEAGTYLLSVAQQLVPQFEHAEQNLAQFASGRRGLLRIGMECHPCYRWLLKVVEPYLAAWPQVDLDVIQKFQFGGIGALFAREIDLLVTPDPLLKRDLHFEPVFDYEQVLVVAADHPLAARPFARPNDLTSETLITYPVEISRLDVYSQFLLPASRTPKRHQIIETTDIMLQMVAAGRGVAALPRWLADEYALTLTIRPLSLGEQGIRKQIHLGMRTGDQARDYVHGFVQLARDHNSYQLSGCATSP